MPTSKKTTDRKRRHNRVRAKVCGSAQRPRLAVYRSNSGMTAQLIDDTGNKTIAGLSDKSEKGTKTEKATLLGKKIAALAKENKIETIVFDRNGYKYHGRVKALAEAAREAGLQF
jgi:large subunit ribosomal protein L18